jgi:hypothetical protein
MGEKPRFTIQLTIRDNYNSESWHHAVGCDEALSISWRDVDDLKAGFMPNMEVSVTMMKQRTMRRGLLIEAARRLAAQMADRLEDSEGWHDPSRVEPARQALRGER